MIELLVVIGIIAVLVCMLLPAIKNAKDTAIMAMCRSNMKQMSSGFIMYSLDNETYFPPDTVNLLELTWEGVYRGPGFGTTAASGVWVPWYSAILAGQYFDQKHICCSNFSPQQQLPSNQVVYCPGWDRQYYGASRVQTGIGYNNNDWPFPNFTSGIDYKQDPAVVAKPFQPTLSVSNASKLVTLVDTNGGSIWGNLTTSNVNYRHLRTCNIAFMDGHVGGSKNAYNDMVDGTIHTQMKK
ncbi:MAG TPA: hypothetical protein DCZ94_14180 [Lentisphaeria bacterium]|nr:MAG: hypothetical protein A2X48_10085 [Lentisphaerae bacterium GWF2_49_21]HBC88094.1 hypothetical protein [Lentisphaeria bacterium]